jgi:hypothetical protein
MHPTTNAIDCQWGYVKAAQVNPLSASTPPPPSVRCTYRREGARWWRPNAVLLPLLLWPENFLPAVANPCGFYQEPFRARCQPSGGQPVVTNGLPSAPIRVFLFRRSLCSLSDTSGGGNKDESHGVSLGLLWGNPAISQPHFARVLANIRWLAAFGAGKRRLSVLPSIQQCRVTCIRVLSERPVADYCGPFVFQGQPPTYHNTPFPTSQNKRGQERRLASAPRTQTPPSPLSRTHGQPRGAQRRYNVGMSDGWANNAGYDSSTKSDEPGPTVWGSSSLAANPLLSLIIRPCFPIEFFLSTK